MPAIDEGKDRGSNGEATPRRAAQIAVPFKPATTGSARASEPAVVLGSAAKPPRRCLCRRARDPARGRLCRWTGRRRRPAAAIWAASATASSTASRPLPVRCHVRVVVHAKPEKVCLRVRVLGLDVAATEFDGVHVRKVGKLVDRLLDRETWRRSRWVSVRLTVAWPASSCARMWAARLSSPGRGGGSSQASNSASAACQRSMSATPSRATAIADIGSAKTERMRLR